jgi:coniferyl-aldehyde dehydrogenase
MPDDLSGMQIHIASTLKNGCIRAKRSAFSHGRHMPYVESQPLGVVGILSRWNYPVQLALIPAIAAFAAGNRVWLKPSERSSRTSGFVASLIQSISHQNFVSLLAVPM